MLDWKNIDLLGKEITIVNSTDESKIGLLGLVIYQTKNIIIIRLKNNKLKTIKQTEIIDIKKK
jgi:RNase P/RNase MRP subunit p29